MYNLLTPEQQQVLGQQYLWWMSDLKLQMANEIAISKQKREVNKQ